MIHGNDQNRSPTNQNVWPPVIPKFAEFTHSKILRILQTVTVRKPGNE